MELTINEHFVLFSVRNFNISKKATLFNYPTEFHEKLPTENLAFLCIDVDHVLHLFLFSDTKRQGILGIGVG
jgi:hypothetical protein